MTNNNPELEKFTKSLPMGFITEKQIPELIKLERMARCLVRCGNCRFVCAAQYVPTLTRYVQASGDYIRDISVVSGLATTEKPWTDICTAMEQVLAALPVATIVAERETLAGLYGALTVTLARINEAKG